MLIICHLWTWIFCPGPVNRAAKVTLTASCLHWYYIQNKFSGFPLCWKAYETIVCKAIFDSQWPCWPCFSCHFAQAQTDLKWHRTANRSACPLHCRMWVLSCNRCVHFFYWFLFYFFLINLFLLLLHTLKEGLHLGVRYILLRGLSVSVEEKWTRASMCPIFPPQQVTYLMKKREKQ